MLQDLQRYTKFIGAFDSESGAAAARHFESAGLKTKLLASPEATELAKLTETTYFGLMIAWAQELERYCDQSSVSYDEIISFYEEIAFFQNLPIDDCLGARAHLGCRMRFPRDRHQDRPPLLRKRGVPVMNYHRYPVFAPWRHLPAMQS